MSRLLPEANMGQEPTGPPNQASVQKGLRRGARRPKAMELHWKQSDKPSRSRTREIGGSWRHSLRFWNRDRKLPESSSQRLVSIYCVSGFLTARSGCCDNTPQTGGLGWHLFLIVLAAGKLGTKVLADPVSGEGLLLLCRGLPACCVLTERRRHLGSPSLFIRALTPLWWP